MCFQCVIGVSPVRTNMPQVGMLRHDGAAMSGCAVAHYDCGDGSYGRIAVARQVAGCWHVVFRCVDVIVTLVN